jgi:hypothetical protein
LDLEQVQAERLDLGQDAVQCRQVQEAGEHGVGAVPLRHQRRERRQHRGAEVAMDPDRVPGGCWVHDAMVECGQVSPHHQDQVIAALAVVSRGVVDAGDGWVAAERGVGTVTVVQVQRWVQGGDAFLVGLVGPLVGPLVEHRGG